METIRIVLKSNNSGGCPLPGTYVVDGKTFTLLTNGEIVNREPEENEKRWDIMINRQSGRIERINSIDVISKEVKIEAGDTKTLKWLAFIKLHPFVRIVGAGVNPNTLPGAPIELHDFSILEQETQTENKLKIKAQNIVNAMDSRAELDDLAFMCGINPLKYNFLNGELFNILVKEAYVNPRNVIVNFEKSDKEIPLLVKKALQLQKKNDVTLVVEPIIPFKDGYYTIKNELFTKEEEIVSYVTKNPEIRDFLNREVNKGVPATFTEVKSMPEKVFEKVAKEEPKVETQSEEVDIKGKISEYLTELESGKGTEKKRKESYADNMSKLRASVGDTAVETALAELNENVEA